MNDPQRYDPIDDAGSGYGHMRLCVDGDYVRHDDVLALRDENTWLQTSVDMLRIEAQEWRDQVLPVREENTRLRQRAEEAEAEVAQMKADPPRASASNAAFYEGFRAALSRESAQRPYASSALNYSWQFGYDEGVKDLAAADNLRALLALARTGIADIDKDYPCERWLELIQRIDAALGE